MPSPAELCSATPPAPGLDASRIHGVLCTLRPFPLPPDLAVRGAFLRLFQLVCLMSDVLLYIFPIKLIELQSPSYRMRGPYSPRFTAFSASESFSSSLLFDFKPPC